MSLEKVISNHPDPAGISFHILKRFYKEYVVDIRNLNHSHGHILTDENTFRIGAQIDSARDHWIIMNEQFPIEFWLNF